MNDSNKQPTARQKLIFILCLLYFVSPIRLLINLIPVIGDVADVLVVLYLIATFRDYLSAAVQSTEQCSQKTFPRMN